MIKNLSFVKKIFAKISSKIFSKKKKKGESYLHKDNTNYPLW